MRVAEIKTGGEYGFSEDANDVRIIPRKVRVIEPVKVEKRIWPRGVWDDEGPRVRNETKFRVEFLDEAPYDDEGNNRLSETRPFSYAPAGQQIVVETKQILAPWSKVREKVGKKIDARDRKKQLEREVTEALTKAGFDTEYVYVDAYVPEDRRQKEWTEVRFRGEATTRLLNLLSAA